ncbi:MAG: discoidin domain-containing protein [Clostridia bacterium]|nr:discoidin domain-containing protein [Clostridia bacterium]
MERTIKNTSGRLLAGFLAVIMVFSLFITMLTELDFASIFASASGDDSGKDDALHTNTAYSNTDYSVITGEIALIGDGFGTKDLSADLKAALGTNAKVKLYTDGQSGVQAALTAAASTDISLVVFACGTRVCIENNGSVATFKSDLDNAVKAFKARGIDVLLVSPGPVTEYGENMYYTEHADVWTPGQVASGDNITNRIKEAVDSITAVAEENNVGFLSVYGKVKLTGEAKYMEGSAEGVFPGEYGYTLMTRWIAEYISENYVFARKQLGSTTTLSGTETVIDLGTAYDDIDGIVLKFPANTTVPSKLSVQSTKSVEDQWFEAVADATVVDEDDYVKVVSLVFESATARYFRVSGDVAFPAGTTAAIYQTALSNPVMTYPVIGDEVSTKHAFNIEWSAVAGADRYDIVIEKADGTVVKTFTTSEDTQAIPAGVLQDGINYNIKISSLCSGYIDMDDHSGAGASGVFSAADDAVYTGNSEKYEESVSAGKLVTIGDQDILSTNVDVTVNGQVTVDDKTTALLTDLGRSDYVGDANMIKLHSSTDGATQVEVILDLAFEADSVTGVFFDASFFALSSSANAKPESVVVSYAGEDGEYSTGRDMAVSSSVRTIRVAEDSEVTGDMTRYGETVGARNIRYVKMVFTFADKDRSDFWLDEIYVVGSADDKGVIARDGVTVLNEGLVGANSFYGTYTAGMWITDPRFVAVASTGAKAVPVELVVNLNADLHNNAIGYADSVVTGVELSFAVDTDAIRPSSIVVSVQKSGETKWTEVGAKVYVNNGTVSADDAEFITEYIPLTSKDASDVLASYVKITLYTDISNTSVPSAYDSTGKWGTWFALSHLDIIGGQYIDSIAADGATAAYHANYLQNTNLLGRDNYGDVNNTDIWNSISWKTAGYKTNDSGYYEILGNVTVGKIYWASEVPSSSATNVIADAETKATNTHAPSIQPKADSNIALGKKYKYSVAPYSSYSDGGTANAYHTGLLTDGDYAEYRAGYTTNVANAYVGYISSLTDYTLTVDLASKYNVSSASIDLYWDTALSSARPTKLNVAYSSDGSTWTTDVSILSNETSRSIHHDATHLNTRKAYTYQCTTTGKDIRYVRFTISTESGTNNRLYMDEIEVMGSEPASAPTGGEITNLAPMGTYAYYDMLPGENIGYADGTEGCTMAIDYEVPNYDAAKYSTTSIAAGGTGYRDTKGVFAKGKLNDGVTAIYTNGVVPYRWLGWYQKAEQPNGMTIVFDLGSSYSLKDVYFRNPRRGNAAGVGNFTVTYYFSSDNSTWSSGVKGTWTADGTLPQSSSNTTAHAVYKSSATAPSGSYRYVKINIDNNTGTFTSATQLFYMDEVVINGYTGVVEGPDTTEKNWALEENGGSYKGALGDQYSYMEEFTSGSTSWTSFHSGKLNDGTISNVAPSATGNFVGVTRDFSTQTVRFIYKLKSRVDVTSVNVYTSASGRTVTVSVGETDAIGDAVRFGEDIASSAYDGTTVVYSVEGAQTGKYVFIDVQGSWATYFTEIEINGVKSAQLDAPVITSHYNEQEIGVHTALDWDDVTVDEDGTIITYSVAVTDKNGDTVTAATGLTASQLLLDSTAFAVGEGYYTITVTASASGWFDGVTELAVYYAPKYIVTFSAADGALLKSSGQTSQQVQFGVYMGAAWTSDEVLGAVANVVALPYTDANGTVYYFSHWVDGDGNVGIPTTGEVSTNMHFTAVYTLDDTTGVTNNNQMTDGVIYDGTGSVSDYYFTFNNDNQSYDYMIIDLGRIYHALTEFDVSFYKMGDVLPFQITFEVSSKVYVPTLSQGAAFDDADWQYVSVVQQSSYVYDVSTGRFSFSDDAKFAPIIDGAFGRYVKVTFHYDTDCEGVYVDEVMVSGSDDHDRTNIAEEKDATVDGVYTELLTNGVENDSVNGSEFIIELDDVKTGITSFQLVGANNASASFYISAGGDNFVLVDTLTGEGEIYKLDDKVSARRIKIALDSASAVSEVRVFGDPGLENYYYVSGISTELKLKSGTVKLDNVISIDAVDAKLYGSETEGDSTTASGANGSGTGFAMTDATDAGYANGVSFVNTDKGRMWYSLYSSKKGITNYINAAVVLQWAPTLDSTAVDFTLGNKTYKFEFNGDVKKGFVILQSGSATPYSYTASRAEGSWTVEFTVPYEDVTSSNVESNVSYTVTAYENGASVGTTGAKTYNTDGTTEGWDYANAASSWTTLSGYKGDVIALIELDRVYYGLNTFAISILDAKDRGYAVPENVRFQVSTDNENWTDVGYTAKETFGDYRYYEQYQPGEAYVYNFSVSFEGISAKYVRAVMHMADTSKKVAVQEFWVNALPKSPKSAGGNSAVNSFDYKMLWDDEYLYIALQYEEDEIPFYTASHDYYETFSVNQDTSKWKTSKNDTQGTTTAFAKSSLFYDDSTGFFQLKHDITTPSSTNTNNAGYSNVNLNNFKLYKVSSIEWNKTYTVTGARFKYGTANLATSIETSEAKYVVDTDINKNTLADDSVMNGYIIVSEGYALSQDIDGSSLAAKPITVDGDTIPADQITNDLVWFFESDELITGLSDYGKTLGDYIIYGYRYENSTSNHVDRIYLDDVSSMEYSKYYLTRAYQGLIWENVYTFTRDDKIPNTHISVQGAPEYIPSDSNANINEGEYNVNYRNNHMSGDINWNVVYDTNTSSWSMYVHAQGYRRYSSFYDNVDGRSAFRLYMSVANLNDTARHDYGNYDFVLDTYIIDDATMTLEDGSTYPLTSDSPYLIPENSHDAVSAWDDYKNVEFKSTAIGMTQETNEYRLDVSKLKGKAKASQSENGQNVFTVEIAIPFTQLGFVIDKTGTTVNKFGNYYTKMGIEKPLGKRTLMQFDSKYDYTADNDNGSNMADVDEFYYYVDASEFGYVLQMAPEGKGYQDLSYTDGDGYSTISSVRGEVLNTDNGKEIEYTPNTFEISKIHTTNADPDYAEIVANLKARDAFIYREENGIYYFDTQFDHNRIINQGGTVSTELVIPKGGAYFSFDWKASTETSDTLSVWVETTERWNEEYKDWIQTYNCGIPYKYYSNATTGSQKTWTGVLDYADKSLYTLYSERMVAGDTSWKVNGVELKNDPCVAFISGYKDITRDPENLVLASWKEMKRSMGNEAYPVNIDDVIVFSPIVSGNGNVDYGMYRHAWDWNNVTIWIPNTTGADLDYTITWMFWKNGSQKESYNASDGRGTDDAQITNFRLSTTDELGYWKNSENWDTLRLDATVADPTETMLGIDRLAKEIVAEGESVPAINATGNNPGGLSENNTDRLYTNTFGESDFLTLSYAAIAATEESGNTTTTTTYYQTKNKISLSASNVPTADIEKYINNAIVFTQEYEGHLSDAGALLDWTILELQYNTSYNTWVLSRMFEEGVDKSKFNIHADNNTIIIALNYTYNATDDKAYGKSRDAVLFGYTNREVLGLLTPAIRYKAGDGKIDEVIAANDASLTVTQFITSNVFIRENFNVARGKMYSLRNLPTYWDTTYMYTENWFRENNTEDALAAFLSVYSETPLYYVNEKGEIGVIGENGTFNPTIANTDGDYRQAFQYKYSSNKTLRFDTNQYGNVLYVPAGVGQLTDGEKMSVYSNSYLVEALEDYAIGFFVGDGMGTPDADVIEDIDVTDTVFSYIQQIDTKHDEYEVKEDIRVREENVILDLGSVEYGLSAFKLRFLGGGEDGVVFPTSVEFAISTDGLSYSYIGSVALDDTGFNSATFGDAYASIIYTGATDTIYGNTVADYTFDLQTEGVTARYIKATIMNHSSQNEKTFISEFQVIQNAIYPDTKPNTNASTWVDVSEDAILMYQDTLERWDNALNKPYAFALAPTTAGYLFAEDEGYADDGRTNNNTNVYLTGQLTDGIGGTTLYKANYAGGTAPTLQEMKDMSVGWMKAYAAEVSLTFDMGELNDVGYVSVYALESKDSVDKINQPYNVTAYVSDDNITWRKVATVNAKDNDSSEVSLKGMDVVVETDDYIVYRYNLTFARDGELGLQLNDYQYVKVVAETDGGEDGWICLTEVEVYEGHPCYPVIDLTDSKFKKTAIGLTEEDVKNQTSEVRPTFFRGFYDSNLYEDEIPDGYVLNVVYNNVEAEQYTRNYVFGNVEQRALDGRDIPYFYGGDQLLLRVTSNQLFATEYNYQGDWVSTYKLLADSRIYYTNVTDTGNTTTRLFTTTAVPTPLTVCNVLARDEFTGALPEDYVGEDAYYYLPIFLKNSLEYLKAEGYNVDKANQGANYINMPENRVELTGEVLWDTNYESDYDEYANDENGISLNLAPLGAKTNLGTVKYNGIDRAEGTTLRFGSIWYIDDAAYYNTHTHRQQYGTLIFTLNNLNRYLTDTFPTRAPYSTVYEDYGLQMTKLNTAVEVTGVEEIKNVIEVIKLTGVTEVKKLSGVAEATEDTAKFKLTVDGELVYYTCDDDIQVNDTIGSVWKTANGYFYSENNSISKYKFTTGSGENTKYWYCTENVDRVNWVDENGYWYSPSEDLVDATDVYSVVLNNGNTVYYHYQTEDETTELPAIKIMSRDSSGVAHYWTCNEDYPSWTYVTVEGNDIRYWYSSNYEGIAGGVVCDENGTYYATSNSVVYNGLITTIDGDGNTRYWSASTEEAFVMLSDLQDIIKYEYDSDAKKFTFDEEQVMAGLDRYLEYANKYGKGQQGHNNNYLTFGGIVQHSRANRYYYYSNITTELVPGDYENGNIFAGVDSDSADGQNMTELLGVYNYDQRYLEFDAIIAGIPAGQKSAKIVAVPYAIYANNYEFLEFGEHLGKDDAYVEETWGEIFNKYYGGENAINDIRYYVYGGAVARSITDVLAAQDDLPKQYD